MSKKTTSLFLGILAMAEAQNSELQNLKEASSNGNLEGYAQRLYADKYSDQSAYERLLNSDKQRKMDYLNNIRDDSADVDELLYPSPLNNRANGIPNDIPTPEYSGHSLSLAS